MTAGARLWRCRACDWRGAPERIWCPRCGADEIEELRVETGTVEEATIVRRSVGGYPGTTRMASIAVDGGGRLIARLGAGAGAGSAVRLEEDGGVAVARPAKRARHAAVGEATT